MISYTPLNEIADIIMGQSPASSTYNDRGKGLPFFQGKAEFDSRYPIAKKWCDFPLKIAEPNDILLSVRAPVGPTNICNIKSCIGRGLAAIRCKKNTDFNFLWFYLRSIEENLSQKGVGSTFTAIGRGEIARIKVPDVDYSTQRKIASILEKAESSVEKRKKANELTDEFLKSVFLEMFGDPVRNPKELGVGRIRDFIENTENENPVNFSSKSYEYIDISSIDNISKKITQIKKIEGNNAPSRARQLVKAGDILVSTVRPNLNAVAIVPDNLINPIASTGFCVLRVNKNKLNALYLFEICKMPFFIETLTKVAKGASYPAVTDKEVKNINILIPSVSLQQKFASIVQKVQTLKQKQHESETELDNLFNSLMQRAFKGELV